MPSRAPIWFQLLDRGMRAAVTWLSCALLVLMVTFTVYTVVMRYLFKDAPFWGDTVSVFCNIWLVLIAYALTVRDREDIAMEGIYARLPRGVVSAFQYAWEAMRFAFGLYLVWFGVDAALHVPGQFWELGGLPKKVPMMALPLCGLLVAAASAAVLLEDAFGWRDRPA